MEQAEIDALVKAFNELGVKPKADSAASLVGWMVDYVSSHGLEQKPVLGEDTKPAMTLPPHEKPVAQQTIPPKIAAFSGEEGKDADYDLWRFEVNCLQTSGSFEEAVILHQVRKSLGGAASHVDMRLGDKASLRDLLSKLDDLYGSIQLPEELLATFYNAKQRGEGDRSGLVMSSRGHTHPGAAARKSDCQCGWGDADDQILDNKSPILLADGWG